VRGDANERARRPHAARAARPVPHSSPPSPPSPPPPPPPPPRPAPTPAAPAADPGRRTTRSRKVSQRMAVVDAGARQQAAQARLDALEADNADAQDPFGLGEDDDDEFVIASDGEEGAPRRAGRGAPRRAGRGAPRARCRAAACGEGTAGRALDPGPALNDACRSTSLLITPRAQSWSWGPARSGGAARAAPSARRAPRAQSPRCPRPSRGCLRRCGAAPGVVMGWPGLRAASSRGGARRRLPPPPHPATRSGAKRCAEPAPARSPARPAPPAPERHRGRARGRPHLPHRRGRAPQDARGAQVLLRLRLRVPVSAAAAAAAAAAPAPARRRPPRRPSPPPLPRAAPPPLPTPPPQPPTPPQVHLRALRLALLQQAVLQDARRDSLPQIHILAPPLRPRTPAPAHTGHTLFCCAPGALRSPAPRAPDPAALRAAAALKHRARRHPRGRPNRASPAAGLLPRSRGNQAVEAESAAPYSGRRCMAHPGSPGAAVSGRAGGAAGGRAGAVQGAGRRAGANRGHETGDATSARRGRACGGRRAARSVAARLHQGVLVGQVHDCPPGLRVQGAAGGRAGGRAGA
jgi:hypothetical protein